MSNILLSNVFHCYKTIVLYCSLTCYNSKHQVSCDMLIIAFLAQNCLQPVEHIEIAEVRAEQTDDQRKPTTI